LCIHTFFKNPHTRGGRERKQLIGATKVVISKKGSAIENLKSNANN
jgi:hypothetical protein